MNLLHLDINWPQLKALHQVYQTGSTRSNLFANSYFERLRKDKRVLRHKSGNRNIIEGTSLFKDFYQHNFLNAYQRYLHFFSQTGVESDGRRPYRLYDLETLIYILEHKSELSASLTTEKTFASQLFNSAKYFENNLSLRNAILQVLAIERFPLHDPKEQTWRLIVDCPNPRMILLCENLDSLKYPDIAIALNVELWYVGGNNTSILKNLSTDKLSLPIFYRCDWDYDGLRTYTTVSNILSEKNKRLPILDPAVPFKLKPVDSPYHNSKWKSGKSFSGLDEKHFNEKQKTLITELIKNDQWIEEESQELETLLNFNHCL